MKIFQGGKKSNFGYNRTKMSGALHEFVSVFNIVDSDICSAIIQRTNGCTAMAPVNISRTADSD
jgi:hypothetical protein